jgi:Kef-type K+ transport system membrane component KefB
VDPDSLLVVLAVAALAPVVADLSPRLRVPTVVAEILLGIIVGPQVLDLASPDELIRVLSQFGLAFLFFMAAMEIDFDRVRGRPLTLAAFGWGASLVLGMVAAAPLYAAGVIGAPILVGLALTTTALGSLVPILKDAGLADGRFGVRVLANGGVGEFGPVIALSVILAIESGDPARSLLLILFAILALATAALSLRVRPKRIVRLVGTTMHASGQLALRLAILLLGGLVVLASTLGLDIVLGAFTAGLIVGLITRGERDEATEAFVVKLDGVGYGFLIPFFFIATGLEFDLDALLHSASSLILVPGFALLFVIVRGLPTWLLNRGDLPGREPLALGLMSASALPLIVAITNIAVARGTLRPLDAAALVGAGMLSLLVFPIVGGALLQHED